MGTGYRQLSLEERCEIAQRLSAGQTVRQIAAGLDRSPSSISRELKRNASKPSTYKPAYAGDQAWARRWRGSRLERNIGLQQDVLDRLTLGWSPAQVSGRLAFERGAKVISHESIYRFVYAQIRRTNTFDWRHYLPRKKFRRGYRGVKGGSPVLHMTGRVSIDERPAVVSDRVQAGHWEADLMAFSIYGQNLLAAQERSSRLMAMIRAPTKQAEPTADLLQDWLGPLPPGLRRSITFDNGTEFASHHRLRERTAIATFFCDPHSPWQKGGVENAIGRMRRQLPRKTDLNSLTPNDIITCVRRYNHTPRQCLGFRTPAEVFSKLLHLECESITTPSPG